MKIDDMAVKRRVAIQSLQGGRLKRQVSNGVQVVDSRRVGE